MGLQQHHGVFVCGKTVAEAFDTWQWENTLKLYTTAYHSNSRMIEDTPMQSSFLAVVSGTGIAAACKPGDRCAKFSGSQKPYTTVDPVVEKVYGLVISIRLNFPVLRTTCITWSRLREFKSWQCQHTFHWRWWMKKCAKLQSFSSELSMPHHPANWWCLGRMLWLFFEQAASNESQSIFVALLEDLEGELICCSFFSPFRLEGPQGSVIISRELPTLIQLREAFDKDKEKYARVHLDDTCRQFTKALFASMRNRRWGDTDGTGRARVLE